MTALSQQTRLALRAGTKALAAFAMAGTLALSLLAAGPVEAQSSGIHALDPGDTVFVQGIFSDERVQIVRLDHSRKTVKVRRFSDGTTYWTHCTNILSRDESTANDIVRGAVVVGAFFCALDPECGN